MSKKESGPVMPSGQLAEMFDNAKFSDRILMIVFPLAGSTGVASCADRIVVHRGNSPSASESASESAPSSAAVVLSLDDDEDSVAAAASQTAATTCSDAPIRPGLHIYRQLHVSSAILASSSAVFKALLSNGMQESTQKRFQMEASNFCCLSGCCMFR